VEEDKRLEPSNPRLYKIAKDESEEARKKRIDRIEADVKTRMEVLVQDTGANSFPSLVPSMIEAKAFIRILEIKGIATENEYEDVYHMLIDERIQRLEGKKEKIKQQVIQKKARSSGGLSLPPGFGKKRTIN